MYRFEMQTDRTLICYREDEIIKVFPVGYTSIDIRDYQRLLTGRNHLAARLGPTSKKEETNMALIGHGTKTPRKLPVITRKARQIRADIPVPDPKQKSSEWAFIRDLRNGESFLAYGERERVNSANYGRALGYKMVTRIDQELTTHDSIMSSGSTDRIYRIWKTEKE